MEFIIVWLLFACIAGRIASSKGRSFIGFTLLSLFLTPVIGIIAALCAMKQPEGDKS